MMNAAVNPANQSICYDSPVNDSPLNNADSNDPPIGPIAARAIAEFCRRWGVARLWLFGSLAVGHAQPDSDADVLVEFLPQSITSTWDWPEMTDQLAAIFGRSVDLHSAGILRNPYRRESITASRRLLYAA